MKAAWAIGVAVVLLGSGSSLAAGAADKGGDKPADKAPEKAADKPREGKYKIYVYGNTRGPALYNGYFVLAPDGTYKAYLPGDKPSGEGKYTFNADKHAVTWDTGPYAGVWDGDFTVENEGKTHKIRLKRNAVATNSGDAPAK